MSQNGLTLKKVGKRNKESQDRHPKFQKAGLKSKAFKKEQVNQVNQLLQQQIPFHYQGLNYQKVYFLLSANKKCKK